MPAQSMPAQSLLPDALLGKGAPRITPARVDAPSTPFRDVFSEQRGPSAPESKAQGRRDYNSERADSSARHDAGQRGDNGATRPEQNRGKHGSSNDDAGPDATGNTDTGPATANKASAEEHQGEQANQATSADSASTSLNPETENAPLVAVPLAIGQGAGQAGTEGIFQGIAQGDEAIALGLSNLDRALAGEGGDGLWVRLPSQQGQTPLLDNTDPNALLLTPLPAAVGLLPPGGKGLPPGLGQTFNPLATASPLPAINLTAQGNLGTQGEGSTATNAPTTSLLATGGQANAGAGNLLQQAAPAMLETLLAEGGGDSEVPAEALSKLTRGGSPATGQFAGLLAQLEQAAGRAERPGFSTAVNVPLNQPQWGQAVGERVMWLANQRINSAEVHLDPPELGPLQVRIQVSHDQQASVTFHSQHAPVREALDQTAQRLREMFEGQGLNLVDVNVSDQSPQGGGEDAPGTGTGGGGAGLAGEAEGEAQAVTVTPISDRLVDHYI